MRPSYSRWRLSHSIAGDTADNVTATSLSGAALEEVDDELAEEQGSAAFDEGPDEACQSSERDEYGNRLNATHWHNSLMAATGMDLMAAARAAMQHRACWLRKWGCSTSWSTNVGLRCATWA